MTRYKLEGNELLEWILSEPQTKANPETGCREWQKYVTKNKCGILIYNNKKINVHRLVWTLHFKQESSSRIYHTCRNKKCITMEHLYEVDVGPTKQSPTLQCTIGKCKKPEYGHGMCRSHFERQKFHGNPEQVKKKRPHNMSDEELLKWMLSEPQIKINPVTGCMDWQGGTHDNGTGYINNHGTMYRVHRMVWQLTNKTEASSFVRHTCESITCINMNHLIESLPPPPPQVVEEPIKKKSIPNLNEKIVAADKPTKINSNVILSQMRNLNLTKTDIGQELGLTAYHVGFILRGLVPGTVDQRHNIALLLRVLPENIWGDNWTESEPKKENIVYKGSYIMKKLEEKNILKRYNRWDEIKNELWERVFEMSHNSYYPRYRYEEEHE